MAVADFEQFARGFCEIAGLKPPDLEPISTGKQAFSVLLRGITVTFVHLRSRPGVVNAIAELGALVALRIEAQLSDLLVLNMVLASRGTVLSRNPVNGEVLLHRTLNIDQIDSPSTLALVDELVWAGQDVRAAIDGVVLERGIPKPIERPGPSFVDWTERFRQLQSTLCTSLGAGDAAFQPGGSSFELHLNEVAIFVAHAKDQRPEVAWLFAEVGSVDSADAVTGFEALLEANFDWMWLEPSLSCSLHPWTHAVYVQRPYALDGGRPEEIMSHARAAAEWASMNTWLIGRQPAAAGGQVEVA